MTVFFSPPKLAPRCVERGKTSVLEIRINGEPRQLAVGTTVQVLLAQLNLDPRYLAVERNLSIVPRAEHVHCVLEDGDQIEIVTLVGGG